MAFLSLRMPILGMDWDDEFDEGYDGTMPIRLAQARLIPRDLYAPTYLRKGPSYKSASPLGRHKPPKYAPDGRYRLSHQGKEAETPD